jgi:hypothetical protein
MLYQLRNIGPSLRTRLAATLTLALEQADSVEPALVAPPGVTGLDSHRYTAVLLLTDGHDEADLQEVTDLISRIQRSWISLFPVLVSPYSAREFGEITPATEENFAKLVMQQPAFRTMAGWLGKVHGACRLVESYEKVVKTAELAELFRPMCHLLVQVDQIPLLAVAGLCESGVKV